jgi:hypothetical protein
MGEESSGQVQTLSMRLTTVLKGRLETMREVASLRRGGTVTTSDVAKGLLEAARDESLEVAEMHGRATEALLTIRQKVDHGQSLSHAEWMFVAHFVQLGTESFYKSPLRPESWSGLLEAFLALHSVRLEGPDRSGYYLSHLAGQTLEREPGDVRSAVMSLLERVRGGAKVHPSVGRALYGLLAGERFSGLASIQAALLPYWPVLWRVAARGHYGQRKAPIHKEETWEEMQERHSGSKAPEHREAIPPFLAGDYRLTVAESIDGDTLSLLLSLPGDHGPMYTMSQYPKIAEFLAMLEGLGPRTVDSCGNVRGDGLWKGETFFGYVVAGSSAEGYWFRDGSLTLGFPPVGWEQVREVFRRAWEHPEVARIWACLEQEYGEL